MEALGFSVCTCTAAGISAFDSESPSEAGDARIEVGDDAAGGVYVSWRFPRKLADEIDGYLFVISYRTSLLSSTLAKYVLR
jgi:hypothetical protein